MLTLARKVDEVIVIDHPDGKIEVMVVRIRGGSVRLGFTAPREIEIHRREVYDAIKREEKRHG